MALQMRFQGTSLGVASVEAPVGISRASEASRIPASLLSCEEIIPWLSITVHFCPATTTRMFLKANSTAMPLMRGMMGAPEAKTYSASIQAQRSPKRLQ